MEDIELMRDKAVAEALDCGVSTVWLYVKQGHLPAPIKIGGATRWFRKDIANFLQKLRDKTEAQSDRANQIADTPPQHIHTRA